MYNFCVVDPKTLDWCVLDNTYDSTVYKTKEWFDYLNLQGCKTFVVQIEEDHELVGYFIGEKIRKIITIIGSPFEGYGTGHQGLSLVKTVGADKRIEIYKALATWMFSLHITNYLQVEDWQLQMTDMPQCHDFYYEPHRVKYVDLTLSEDELYENLHKDCKYSIRKAQSNGIVVRETEDIERFIDVFYAQLEDVLDKKGLQPTRDKENVRKLITATWPQETMLLESVTQDGEIAATGIIPIHGQYSATWQTASFRSFQKLRPNEILRWEAMIRCKRRGATMINFCGTQEWKDKFGCTLIHTPRLIFCKYPIILKLKQFAKWLYYYPRLYRDHIYFSLLKNKD